MRVNPLLKMSLVMRRRGDFTGTMSRVKSVGYCVPEELNKSWTSTSTPGVAAHAKETMDAKRDRNIMSLQNEGG